MLISMRKNVCMLNGLALLALGLLGCDSTDSPTSSEDLSSSATSVSGSSAAAKSDTVFAPITFNDNGDGSWAVSGSLHSFMGLINVQLDLRSTNGDSVGGLLYYTFAEVAVAQGGDYLFPMLEDIELGAGGMDVRLYQRDMGGACGTFVLTATGLSNGYVDYGDGTVGSYMVYGRGQVTVPCTATSEPAAPQVYYDATQDLSKTIDARRYFPVMAVPGHYAADIDTATDFSSYGKSVLGSTLTPALAANMDILFDGKNLLTPYGAVLTGFHARFFKDLPNEIVLVELDAANKPSSAPVHVLEVREDLRFALMAKGKKPIVLSVREYTSGTYVELTMIR